MRLFDAFNREIEKGLPVVADLGSYGAKTWGPTYPSQGLTPERLAGIFREADSGDIARQAELFEEMEEKDAHLGSVLQTRKLAVSGLGWEIIPASDSDEDGAIAGFVKTAFDWIENRDEAIVNLLDAVGKGFAVSEIMWEIDEGKVWIRELKWRHQGLFTFAQENGQEFSTNGDMPRLLTDSSPSYGEELIPNKFIVHRYRARTGYPARAGVLRPCAYMYLFKNYCIKDWVIFAERYAMPMRIGKFNPSATESERRALKNAVFNLGSDAAAVISDSTVIELLDTASKGQSADVYSALANFCDSAISKAVLGQTLTTEQASGSYATARIHQKVRQDILEADASALSSTLTMQLIRPLVEFNFGRGTNIPAFKFRHEKEEDLKSLAETLAIIVKDMGYADMPKSFVRNRFGIPLPVGNEETVGGKI